MVVLMNDEELDRVDRMAEQSGLARGTFIRQRLLYEPLAMRAETEEHPLAAAPQHGRPQQVR